MGMTHNVYVGPYIKLKHKMEEKTEIFTGCVNSACNEYYRSNNGNYANGMYCPRCGNTLGEWSSTEKVPVLLHDIIVDQFKESLYYAPGHGGVLLCNRDIDGRLSHFDEYDDDREHQIHDPEQESLWFCNEYEKEIKALQNATDWLEVRWGVVTFSM